MATELNYNDYTHDYMGKVGNIEDFSREFLVKLVYIYADTIHYLNYAWTTVYSKKTGKDGKKMGKNKMWDLAGQMSRGNLRQIMPMGRFIAPKGWDWKNAQYQANPFECHIDDLSKPALIRLAKTYWDQYLKAQNYWIDTLTPLIDEAVVWNSLPELYTHIIDYEYPKLADICKIEPNHVVDFLKLSSVSIDGTNGYGGDFEIIDPDHAVLKMYKCEVLQKYREEGLYPPDRAWQNCTYEKMISEPFFPTCKLEIDLPPKDLKIKPGEPYCVWHYTKE